MIIRVRTNVGQWRIDSESLSLLSTGKDLLDEIAVSRPSVEYTQPLSFDPAGKRLLDLNQTLQQLNIQHGAMIYCLVDPTTVKAISNPNQTDNTNNNTNTTNAAEDAQPADPKHMKRVILPDGSISLVHDPDFLTKDKSFRKGMLPLKSMKMQWTLQEFVAMDDQFVFKITRQQERWVGDGGVSLDQDSANAFQAYLRNFAFQRQRFGYLYGKFIDEKETEEEKRNRPKKEVLFGTELPGTEFMHVAKNQKVIVEAIYEPPQEYDPDAAEGFIALDDPNEEKIEALANMLGLKRVGWIFGHPPREKGFQMASSEIIMAAELQIEAAQGVDETPFVTVKVTAGDDGNVSFEAFQVSKQCMEMVAEEALVVGENPGFCYVNETFSAIQEGKNSNMIENNFFLTVVPIVQHSSEMFVSDFPKANRDHDSRQQTHDEMKKQLQKSGSAGWTFVDLLADFNMLIYLTKFLDLETDIPKICRSIVDRDIPLEEGYKLIIASMAGLDGAY
jgi:nuclear protein localization family protein 4